MVLVRSLQTCIEKKSKAFFMHIGCQGEPEKLAAGLKENATPAKWFSGDVPKEGKIDAAPKHTERRY